MGKHEEQPLQSGFTLGQLLPIRIHDYITTILFHRRHDNLEGMIDILEQWGFDVTSYMDAEQTTTFDNNIEAARKLLNNPYKKPDAAKKPLREVERLLHRVSDTAGLKASNIEAQQIIDTESLAADLDKYKEALGRA